MSANIRVVREPRIGEGVQPHYSLFLRKAELEELIREDRSVSSLPVDQIIFCLRHKDRIGIPGFFTGKEKDGTIAYMANIGLLERNSELTTQQEIELLYNMVMLEGRMSLFYQNTLMGYAQLI